MQKFSKVLIKPKKNHTYMTVKFNKNEVGRDGQTWDAKWSKESNQLVSRELANCIDRLIPHLMYASELADDSIKLDRDMDYEKWFKECHYNDDKRFDNITITGISFIGTQALDAVKIYGYKETARTDKPFKVKIETPVINLDRVAENKYPLVAILDDQINDLQLEIEEWLEKGKTVTQGELSFRSEHKLEKAS